MSLFISWLESMYMENSVTSQCLRHRNPNSTCTRCLDACDQAAILFKDGKIQFDQIKCNSCGACVIACSLSAIKGIPSNRQFVDGCLVSNDFFIPTVKELLIYKKRGMTSLLLGDGRFSSEWEKTIRDANACLVQLGEEPIDLMKKAKQSKLSRRSLFSSVQKQGQQLAKKLAPAEWRGLSNWNLASYYPNRQFNQVEINQGKCTFCRSCMILCPQDVFQLSPTTVQVNNSRCVDCGLCTDLCMEDALMISTSLQNATVSEYQYTNKECCICGNEFQSLHSEETECFICSDRDPTWLLP